MHPNPHFRKETNGRNLAFVRERGFGALAINAADGPLVSHVPFNLLDDDRTVELHLLRSNPIVQILKQEQDQPAVLAVTGSDSYVSPDWYGVDDQVPTWNYVAVHLRGRLSLMPSASLHKVLCGISATMEARLLPKKPWTTDKMTPEIYERMQRQIVPVSLDVDTIEGTWKLSQNKPAEVRLAAAEMVADHGQGSEIRTMSGLMNAAENNQDD